LVKHGAISPSPQKYRDETKKPITGYKNPTSQPLAFAGSEIGGLI